MKRNLMILLALVTLTAATTGCARCRNLFRRGSPCCGTRTAAPAMIGAPIAIGRPFARPAPTVIAPQMIAPQVVAPHTHAVPCCPQYCDPCPTQCIPCDPCGVGGQGGAWFGGYVGDGVVEGSGANCGPTSTYAGEYGGVIDGGVITDPGPTGDN